MASHCNLKMFSIINTYESIAHKNIHLLMHWAPSHDAANSLFWALYLIIFYFI